MSTVELIVAALAAGAGAGMKETASTAVRDAYTGLKSSLGQWLADRPSACEALAADEIEPDVWRARIGQDLIESGAVTDQRILAAAEQLLALADPAATATLNIRVGTNHGAIGTFSAPVTFHQAAPIPPVLPEVNPGG